ncbi:hypothetical protein MFIFM68171_01872 [Madurella fahalii]|uniref:Uncharacterized protein n=1 Tax=Madurella fahalii TaxID=1157608 RepID=A0ABQ0G1M5_9PEZI
MNVGDIARSGQYEAIKFWTLPAEDRERKITWKSASPFIDAGITIGGERLPHEELRKEGGSAIVPAGKEVFVLQMEVKFE